jgi:LacI family transcriptional regulator
MRARLKDVAAKAGVATNTASTILNRRSNSWASKETAARVFKAAEELGYKPSRAALGLRLGSFKTVGLIIGDFHNPFYTSFADFMEWHLKERGYDLVIEHTRNDFDHEAHCLESILDRQIDAVAYFVSDLQRHIDFLEKAKRSSKKVVGLTGPSPEGKTFPFDAVEMHFTDGMNKAVDHLVGLGHKKFAFLCAVAKGQKAGDRPRLFYEFLEGKGIPREQVGFIECTSDLASARDRFGEFLDANKGDHPTALIAINDLSAIGAMRAAYERGIRIPEDLSVVGVDNIPLGDFLHRRLSTIEQNLDLLAKAAVDIIIKRLESDDSGSEPISSKYFARFVDKDTTAAVPAIN